MRTCKCLDTFDMLCACEEISFEERKSTRARKCTHTHTDVTCIINPHTLSHTLTHVHTPRILEETDVTDVEMAGAATAEEGFDTVEEEECFLMAMAALLVEAFTSPGSMSASV